MNLLQKMKAVALPQLSKQKEHGVFIFTTILTLALTLPVVSVLIMPLLGIALSALLCLLLVTVGILQPSLRRVAFGLALLPVAINITFSLPVESDDFTRNCIFYAALLVLSVWYQFLTAREAQVPRSSSNYFILLPQALVVGQLLAVATFAFAPEAPAGMPLVTLLGGIFLAAAAEAVYLQGIVHTSLRTVMPVRFAAALTILLGTTVYASILPLFAAAIVVAALTLFYAHNRSVPAAIVASVAFKTSLFGLLLL